MKKFFVALPVFLLLIGGGMWWRQNSAQPAMITSGEGPVNQLDVDGPAITDPNQLTQDQNPLQIEVMRQLPYPGSELVVVDELPNGNNYSQSVVSYESEGNTIQALLTIPLGEKPATGWPVIIFNHGYIAPDIYRTTERYQAYQDYFARNGYIVFKSDYRGHGDSEGEASGGYGSPGYTIDVLNGVASLKQHPDVDVNRIGMWGHSMGGYITLRSMVITKDIKAGVIWGGVAASYADLLENWRRRSATPPPLPSGARRWRDVLQQTYGTPAANPTFWNSISANSYLSDVSGPLQLHHAKGDESVPWEFSQSLADQLIAANQIVDLHLYEGDNHNISENFSRAMRQSLEFFDTHVKNR